MGEENRGAGRKVIFLDRDGTMNEEVHYLHRPEDLRLLPGVAEAVRRFNAAGYQVIVVTNQAGVARGYYSESDVEKLHEYMNSVLMESGAHVDGFYYCPHHPEHGIGAYRKVCHCRKPDTGMFEAAERQFQEGINRAESYMIGDKLLDTEAGRRYGVKTVLVGTGYGSQIRRNQAEAGLLDEQGRCADGSYDIFAEDLPAAADLILNRISE